MIEEGIEDCFSKDNDERWRDLFFFKIVLLNEIKFCIILYLYILISSMNFYMNHSVVQTSVPQNEAELQLYRVMQRASLLSYYDTLLEMGKE